MNFQIELSKAKTVRQVFDVVNKYYDTDEPLTIVKEMIIKTGMVKAIDTIRPKKR